MRLLYLSTDPGIPVFGGKGASVHVRAMVRALSEIGHDVIVVSPRVELGEESLPETVRCIEIPSVKPRNLQTAAEVAAAVDAQAIQVLELARDAGIQGIYERYSLTGCAGARAARALGVPLVVEVNAPLREEERRFRHLAHEGPAIAAERETFSAATLVVAVSDWLANWLRSQDVAGERIVVIPNPAPAEAFAERTEFSDDQDLTVGFSGSLKPWHGISTLLAGFRQASEAGARIRLEVLGHGPEMPAVEQAAAEGASIAVLGHLPHGAALERMRSWEIGVAPYTTADDFYFSPLKVAEYMAAGLCPIVSDVGGLGDMVERGQAGVVIPPDDSGALAEALLALDADRDRLRRLGRRAQAVARRQPTWAQAAQRVTLVFESSCRTSRVPA